MISKHSFFLKVICFAFGNICDLSAGIVNLKNSRFGIPYPVIGIYHDSSRCYRILFISFIGAKLLKDFLNSQSNSFNKKGWYAGYKDLNDFLRKKLYCL